MVIEPLPSFSLLQGRAAVFGVLTLVLVGLVYSLARVLGLSCRPYASASAWTLALAVISPSVWRIDSWRMSPRPVVRGLATGPDFVSSRRSQSMSPLLGPALALLLISSKLLASPAFAALLLSSCCRHYNVM